VDAVQRIKRSCFLLLQMLLHHMQQ
jgi:hypothetical protein